MTKKTKSNKRSNKRDECQTPWYAVDPILRVLKKYGINPLKEKITVWEPFAGEGLLEKKLKYEGFKVVATDILSGLNFFDLVKNPKAKKGIDLVLSNPPFSQKYEVIKLLYDLGIPWALLVPVETIAAGKAQKLFDENGIIKIFLNKRVDYKMPFKGWEGTADFPSMWLLYLPGMKKETITIYETIDKKGVRGDELTVKLRETEKKYKSHSVME